MFGEIEILVGWAGDVGDLSFRVALSRMSLGIKENRDCIGLI